MEIVFAKRFMKQIRKFDKSIQSRFADRFEIFQHNPYDQRLRNHQLNPPYQKFRSISVTGDIRIHYYAEGDKIILHEIGTHAQLYG